MSDHPRNVVSLAQERQNRTGTLTGEVECLEFRHVYTGVAPLGTLKLECPNCGRMTARFRYDVDFPGLRWTCNCGNQLFVITLDGPYCPACGTTGDLPEFA